MATDTEFATDANNTPSLNEQIDVNSKDVPETAMSKEAQKIAGPSKEQPRGLLQRLMRKLLVNRKGHVMKENKIIFTGPVGVGKTTAISALSDEPPVQTDASASDITLVRKGYTTVAMDYGVIHLDEETKVHLYGTPGQERFNFMGKF